MEFLFLFVFLQVTRQDTFADTFRDRDNFGVTIYAGVDIALIFALIVIMDEIYIDENPELDEIYIEETLEHAFAPDDTGGVYIYIHKGKITL